MQIKKGDTVVVIAGKNKFTVDKKGNKTQTTGKVLEAFPAKNKVIVEGVNKVKKHLKPTQQNQSGSIIEVEAPIDASNVMLLHNGKATRVGFKMDGDKKVRFAKATGEVID